MTAREKEFDKYLERIAEELDISQNLFERAETSYKAVGEYISNHCDFPVDIYTQGSFRLGTVIRPISDEDEYDLDLVCEIAVPQSISAAVLKSGIGETLSNSDRYKTKLKEKKRCWRIEYADQAQFHMDITPAKPHVNRLGSIEVTDTIDFSNYSYKSSNPKGFEEWFVERKQQDLSKKIFVADSIEPVKRHKNKSPLQRAIQILKRHRDIMFQHNQEDAPISIIITTLAALAYSGQENVYSSLSVILDGMSKHIKVDDGFYSIPNPSNTEENFADKWNIKPQRAEAFAKWLTKAKLDLIINPMNLDGINNVSKAYQTSLGENITKRVFTAFAEETRSSRETGGLYITSTTGHLTNHVAQWAKEVKGHTFFGE